MSAVNPPWACQGRTDHPAALVRMSQASLRFGNMALGATVPVGGVHAQYGQALAISGLASMNVQVGTGVAVMPSSTAWNGTYTGYNTASFNLAIAAASTTQWRTDLVYAVTTDPGDNTANWNVAVATGTFSSSSPGTTPTLPNNAIPLALVRVVPNMTVTNGAGTVVDSRVFLPLDGPWPTTSAAAPVGGTQPDGTMWYETDTDQVGILVNGTKQYFLTGSAPDTMHTSTAFVNGWTGIIAYIRSQDGWVDFSANIATSPFGTDNQNFWNIPTGYQATGDVSFQTTSFTTTPPSVQPWVRVFSSNMVIQDAAASTGSGIRVTGRYRCI